MATSGLSDYSRNLVLDLLLGDGVQPATVYVGLVKEVPTALDDGSTILEPDTDEYEAYTRVAVTNNATNWPAAASGQKSNGVDITFPASAGGVGAPVRLKGFVVCDSLTDGEVLTWGPLVPLVDVSVGAVPFFEVGTLVTAATNI